MEIQLAAERLFVLEDRLTAQDAEQRAGERRGQAFGSGIGSLLQRPKTEEIVLIASQRRLDPFWHVVASGLYVYERNRDYTVPASSPEVEAVTVEGVRYELDRTVDKVRAFRMPALEHCRDSFRSEAFTDGLAGVEVPDGAALVAGVRTEVQDPQTLTAGGTIVVPPEQRASFVVRKALTEVMKPVQADRILEESIALETTDLYYRPVFAFEFAWQGRDKTGVIEIDGVTGQMRQSRALVGQFKGIISRDLLFDVGADTVGMFVPGGSIAVKLAKAAIDRR